MLLLGCSSAAPVSPAVPKGTLTSDAVYAAVGASETVGFGISDHALALRAAWPQLFFNEALGLGATYYNFAIPGATAAIGLSVEAPEAIAVRPTVVSVILGSNDLLHGVPVAQFESDLEGTVGELSQGGRAVVLLANLFPLNDLPGVLACLPGAANPSECVLNGEPGGAAGAGVTSLAQLDSLLDAFNAAVAAVAEREGAVLVDLASQGAVLAAHPEYLAPDGFHPSPQGAAAIAAMFAAAYRAHRGDSP